MANYRISYEDAGANPRTIDLLPGDDGVRVEWRTDLNRNITSTGIYENVIQHTLRYVTFDVYFRETEFHKLETFMSFAQQGQPFSFTKDTGKATSYTLNSDVSAGATNVLSVDEDPTTELSSGDYIYVADTFGTKWEIGEVDTLSSSAITLVDSVHYDYVTDDAVIRWYYYFPELFLLDDTFDPDRDGAFWNHTFNCVEVRSGT